MLCKRKVFKLVDLVDAIKAQFMRKWECRDLGEPNEFLRMHITRKGHPIHLNQCAYLQKVIERCGMENAKTTSTPLLAGYYAAKNTEPINMEFRSCFQTVIGSLLYLMLDTRPDIAFAVTHLSHHAANPSQDHLNKALYICRYLIGRSTYSLVYNSGSGAGLICMHRFGLGIRPYLSPLADRFLPEACRWLDQLDFSCTEDYCVLVYRS